MRVLLIVILVAAGLWAGYWFVGARALETVLARQIAQAQDAGWQIAYDRLDVRGFPNRFDTTAEALSATATLGPNLTAERLQIFALSYQPNHVIADAAELVLQDPSRSSRLRATGLQGSVVATAAPSLPLKRATLILSDVAAKTPSGEIAADQARFAVRTTPAIALSYDVGLEVLDVDLAGLFSDPTPLPPKAERLWADLRLRLDRPLNRHLSPPPVVEHIDLRGLRVTWGAFTLAAQGAFDVDDRGELEGDISLQAEAWPKLVEALQSSDWLPEQNGAVGLSALSATVETEAQLEISLKFQDGGVYLGGFRIADAPRLRIK